MNDETTTLRSVCAWCGLILRHGAEPASHDICPSCTKKLLEEARQVTMATQKQQLHCQRYGRKLSQADLDEAADLTYVNDNLPEILRCGQRYDRIAYSASVLVGCIAAGGVLLAGVWFVQWMGWWPR